MLAKTALFIAIAMLGYDWALHATRLFGYITYRAGGSEVNFWHRLRNRMPPVIFGTSWAYHWFWVVWHGATLGALIVAVNLI